MKTLYTTILTLFLFFTCIYSHSESGSIGDIDVSYDDDSVIITVYDVSVKGMKGKEVHFGFQLSQDGEWIEDSWKGIEPQTVLYNPAYWNDDAFWCPYSYEYLSSYGDPKLPFYCSFFIINTAKGSTIGRKDIEFSLYDILEEEEEIPMSESYLEVEIEYRKALGDRILIKDGTLYYSYVVDYSYDNPVSANVTTSYETVEAELTPLDIESLCTVFYENNWHNLREGYGVAENQRYYPEIIRMKDTSGEKEVIYRGGQGEEEYPKPVEFDNIVRAVKDLNERYFQQ
jgi:hypothetical protein